MATRLRSVVYTVFTFKEDTSIRSALMVPVVMFAPLMVVLPEVLSAENVTYPDKSMVSATSLTARSVMVKLEEDVPLATIQLILLAVCDTVEMAPSADSTRDVMEVTL